MEILHIATTAWAPFEAICSFSLDDDFEIFAFRIGERRLSMFQLAIAIRLLVFAVFVACVYGGNVLHTRLEYRKAKFFWKIGFVTLYSFFLLLVTYVVWFVFYFGLNT